MEFLLLLLPLGLFFILVFNGLINRRNQVRLALSSIDVQLKYRHDLVPNLVETVKKYASHEREVFEAVAKARSQAAASGAGWAKQEHFQQVVSQLIARAEAYPELKASDQFLMFQRQLSECEAQIAAARRSYAASVMDYHNSIEMFPSSLVAAMFRFQRAKEFEIAIEERSAQRVSF
jgi:LemA protein